MRYHSVCHSCNCVSQRLTSRDSSSGRLVMIDFSLSMQEAKCPFCFLIKRKFVICLPDLFWLLNTCLGWLCLILLGCFFLSSATFLKCRKLGHQCEFLWSLLLCRVLSC